MTRMTWAGKGASAGAALERGLMMEAAERWNEEVRRTVPAERLLELEAAGRLGASVRVPRRGRPAEPLPNVDDTAAFKEGMTASPGRPQRVAGAPPHPELTS